MKTCNSCGELKSLELFAKQKEKKDGRHGTCKACRSLYDKVRYNPKERSELYKTNIELEREKRRKYYQENKDSYYANKANRRAALLQRTPKWLTQDDFLEIKKIYKKAAKLRKLGFNCEVDHDIPMQGELVSGLHVPSNLVILEKSKNRSKSNKFVVE